jgi:plastocyanin
MYLIVMMLTLSLVLAACGGKTAVTPSLSVSDQDASDGMVVVDSATSAQAGWMVIHADGGGSPGPVIGYSAVAEGENSNISVAIDLEAATETLFAMLHIDAGTASVYEFPGADEPAMADGSVVVQPFTVTLPETGMDEMDDGIMTNSLSVSDQDASDGTVLVDSATSAQAGWMVIHADGGGSPGPVIGYSAVAEGENSNVAVDIDLEAATETLFAMLHIDAGTAGTYEFPGADEPAMSDGSVVVQAFTVTLPESGMDEEMEDDEMMGEEVATTIMDSSYEPAEITVSVGTTVVWTMNANLPHTVTADDGSFDSGTLGNGESFSFTFEQSGEFPYYCAFHGGPGGAGMSGTVIVEE